MTAPVRARPGWRRGFGAALLIALIFGALPILAQPEPDPITAPTPGGETETPASAAEDPTATASPTPSGPPTATLTPTITLTPTPDVPDFVMFWTNRVFFPQAVELRIVIGYPLDQIAELSLTVDVPGQPPRTLNREQLVAEALADTASTFTDIRLLLTALRDDDIWLPLLAPVAYEWEIVITSGERASVPDAFAFNDPDTPWQRDDDPEGVLNLLYPAQQISPLPLRLRLRQALDLLARNTNADAAPVVSLALMPAANPLHACASDAVIPCDPRIPQRLLADIGFTPLAVSAREGIGLQQELMNYFIQQFYGPLWADRPPPDWFRMGLETLYTPSDHSGLLEQVRSAARINRLYGLDDAPAFDAPDRPLWEAQAYTMLLYVARRAGMDAVFELAQTGDADETFAESYARIIGQPLTALLPGWRNWIYSGVAERDARLLLYDGPTPVPSPTASVTPFPASPTPTATDTPTITPTPTVTGVLTATPLPTLTPTLSPTPRPPTLTPRPAALAATPTLTPAPPSNGLNLDLDAQTTAALIAGLTVILVAALLAVYLRLGRKP